jgi:hypothetical protein
MIWGSKMKKTLRFFSLGSAAVLLTACVGGAGDPFEQDPPYPYSESHPNDETQNVLGGTAIRSNAATGELQMVTLTGTKYHDTRATVVSDGSYTLVDDDGFDRADRISDGHSTLSLRPVFQNYTALRVFDQAYAVNGVRFDSVGILGVLTRFSVFSRGQRIFQCLGRQLTLVGRTSSSSPQTKDFSYRAKA